VRVGVGALLALVVGLHWGVLQTVAWSTMFIGYSQELAIEEALHATFDASTPCALCRVVRDAGERTGDDRAPEPPQQHLLAVLPDSSCVRVSPARADLIVGHGLRAPRGAVAAPDPPPPRA